MLKKISFLLIVLYCQITFAQINEPSKINGGSTICISEIQYHADSSVQTQDWIELHNYGSVAINISSWKIKDESIINSYTIAAGTTINAGDYLVVAQRTDTFTMQFPFVSPVVGPFVFGLDNGGGSVRLFDELNVLVAQVDYLDSLPWPSAADGLGPTLQIIDVEGDENDPANWTAGCVSGSPGMAYSTCNYPILISEINYNSSSAYAVGDWLELLNPTNTTLNLSGWKIKDSKNSNTYTVPAGTLIEPDERIVVVDSFPGFNSYFSLLENVIGELGFSLANSGDAIRLFDATNKLIYSVKYNDKAPWPIDADGESFTLELFVEDGNPNEAENWIVGCPLGSPTTSLILPCGSAVNNLGNSLTIQAQPNPFTNHIVFNFQEMNTSLIQSCSIANMFGQTIGVLPKITSNTTSWNGRNNQDKETNPGLYFLIVTLTNGEIIRIKMIKI